MKSERKVYIYILTEQGSNDVRYVGQTVNLEDRLIGHLDPSKMSESNPKRIWIEDVISRGSTLSINAIEETVPSKSREREQYWIDYYTESGAVLTNRASAASNPVLWRDSVGIGAMPAIRRAQLTTYFGESHIDLWNELKCFYDGKSDAEIIRVLIENEIQRIRSQPQVDIVDLLARVEALEEWRRSLQ